MATASIGHLACQERAATIGRDAQRPAQSPCRESPGGRRHPRLAVAADELAWRSKSAPSAPRDPVPGPPSRPGATRADNHSCRVKGTRQASTCSPAAPPPVRGRHVRIQRPRRNCDVAESRCPVHGGERFSNGVTAAWTPSRRVKRTPGGGEERGDDGLGGAARLVEHASIRPSGMMAGDAVEPVSQ